MSAAKEHRGTDETFLQLMQLSGSSLLRLAGIPKKVAESYQFRATVFKRQRLEPDVEGIPGLESEHGRVFIEFQGYHDPLIRCRMTAEVAYACTYLPDEKPVKGMIIYTDKAYQKAAIPVRERATDIRCHFREIVLSDYSETRLIKIDPRLVVLAPFTVPKKTLPEALTHKARHWHDRVCKVYPVDQQDDALAILGLFMFDRFRTLDRKGVIKMLNLDWNNNPMVQELRQEGMQQGMQQGIQQGMQRALMEVLHNRFANVSESMAKQIETIQSTELLTDLLRKALQCNDRVAFEKILFHHLNR